MGRPRLSAYWSSTRQVSAPSVGQLSELLQAGPNRESATSAIATLLGRKRTDMDVLPLAQQIVSPPRNWRADACSLQPCLLRFSEAGAPSVRRRAARKGR